MIKIKNTKPFITRIHSPPDYKNCLEELYKSADKLQERNGPSLSLVDCINQKEQNHAEGDDIFFNKSSHKHKENVGEKPFCATHNI